MASQIKNIDSEILESYMSDDSFVVIDVREVSEHKLGAIPKSINIPLSAFTKKAIDKYKNKKIIVSCQAGIRSAKAAKYVHQWLGKDVFNYTGGYAGYLKLLKKRRKLQKKDKNMECDCPNTMPIMQQTQVVIGLGVIIGILLSHYVAMGWIFLSLFFGAGLTFAGITGKCGLAIVMSYMPWNKN